MEYFAYGESFVEEHKNSHNSPYKYNGKELDEETGWYYYGARYYDPKVSLWLGVDPIEEKNPGTSPYAYCLNNPVRFVDPDGKLPILPILYYFAAAKALERYSGEHTRIKSAGYAMQHPINAYKIGEYNYESTNITTVASNFEINIVKNTHGLTRGEEGTHGNAIRHVIWQAIITKNIDFESAERAGNAHENISKVDLSKRIFTNMPDADQTVDLLNNIIGRNIGQGYPDASNQDIAKKTIDEYYTNGLWKVEKIGENNYFVRKTKLTQRQYEEALKEVKKLNDNGKEKKNQ